MVTAVLRARDITEAVEHKQPANPKPLPASVSQSTGGKAAAVQNGTTLRMRLSGSEGQMPKELSESPRETPGA